jgi:hypothetical protein
MQDRDGPYCLCIFLNGIVIGFFYGHGRNITSATHPALSHIGADMSYYPPSSETLDHTTLQPNCVVGKGSRAQNIRNCKMVYASYTVFAQAQFFNKFVTANSQDCCTCREKNHPAPRVINTNEHAGYPPAIVRLKAEKALEENCWHRPVQYLNNVSGTGSPGHQTPGARQPTFSLILGSWRTIAGYEAIHMIRKRPGVREYAEGMGRSPAPLHSRSIRCEKLNFQSSTPTFGSGVASFPGECEVLRRVRRGVLARRPVPVRPQQL